jgi:hypothetical protein
MIRAAATLGLAVVVFAGVGAEALAQGSDTGEGGGDPLPDICAATAVDATTGALGNGTGRTMAAAREEALKECEEAGGADCAIASSACNPDLRDE